MKKNMIALMIALAIIVMAMPVMAADGKFVYPEDELLKDCKYVHHATHPKLGVAAKLPLGALVTTKDNGDGTRTVSFTGVPPIYNNTVELYGAEDGIYVCPLDAKGNRVYPGGMWYNTIFDKNGLNHFIFFANENQAIAAYYFGEGTCGIPDFGKGSAGIYCGDLIMYKMKKEAEAKAVK